MARCYTVVLHFGRSVLRNRAMPTIKPRINVTLEPMTYDVISRLATLSNKSRARIIAELLDPVVPALARTVGLLEAAAEAPEQVKKGFREVVEGLREELTDVAGDAAKQLDILLDRIDREDSESAAECAALDGDPSVAAQGSDPHVVTRGSGIPVGPAKGRKKPTKTQQKSKGKPQ